MDFTPMMRSCYMAQLTSQREIIKVALTQSHEPFKSRQFSSAGLRRRVRESKHKKESMDMLLLTWRWRGPYFRTAGSYWGLCVTPQLTASKEVETSVIKPQEMNSVNTKNEPGSRFLPRASKWELTLVRHLDFSLLRPWAENLVMPCCTFELQSMS